MFSLDSESSNQTTPIVYSSSQSSNCILGPGGGEYIYDMGPASGMSQHVGGPPGTAAGSFHLPAPHPVGIEAATSNAAALRAGSNPLATGRCDLCHGNDSHNMKTGQPELQIACSDCHRTG